MQLQHKNVRLFILLKFFYLVRNWVIENTKWTVSLSEFINLILFIYRAHSESVALPLLSERCEAQSIYYRFLQIDFTLILMFPSIAEPFANMCVRCMVYAERIMNAFGIFVVYFSSFQFVQFHLIVSVILNAVKNGFFTFDSNEIHVWAKGIPKRTFKFSVL